MARNCRDVGARTAGPEGHDVKLCHKDCGSSNAERRLLSALLTEPKQVRNRRAVGIGCEWTA